MDDPVARSTTHYRLPRGRVHSGRDSVNKHEESSNAMNPWVLMRNWALIASDKLARKLLLPLCKMISANSHGFQWGFRKTKLVA